MNSTKVKGYLLGIIAAATYGLNPLFALPLMNDGINATSVLFFRYLLAIPIVAIMIVARGRSFRISPNQLKMLIGFGILMGLSSVFLFESYYHMEVGIASTMLFVYPLMVAIIMAIFFKERLLPLTWLSLFIALIGVCLLYNGENGSSLSFLGTIFVMASALSYALYIVGINRSSLSNVPTLVITFYVLIFGMFVFGVDLSIKGSFTTPSELWQWGCVGALALLPTVISFLCTTAAISYIGSTPTAILGALEPVTAVIVGIFAFDETLTTRDYTGLTLIIGAVIAVISASKLQHYLTSIRKLFPIIKK